MLALCIAAHAFSAPTMSVTHMARSSPVQMKAVEMPSRRAAVLSAASLLMVPLAAQAAPEDYVGGCMFCPTHFATRALSHRPVLCLFDTTYAHPGGRAAAVREANRREGTIETWQHAQQAGDLGGAAGGEVRLVRRRRRAPLGLAPARSPAGRIRMRHGRISFWVYILGFAVHSHVPFTCRM